jgi:hypothetical protein
MDCRRQTLHCGGQIRLGAAFEEATANVSHHLFHSLIEQFDERVIIYVDKGFRAKKKNPSDRTRFGFKLSV